MFIPTGVCPWGLVEVLRDWSGGARPGDDCDADADADAAPQGSHLGLGKASSSAK